MAHILRLKRYKTYFFDGRSSVTYDALPGRVNVAVIVGSEPLKLGRSKACDVDSVIVAMAEHIRKHRRAVARKKIRDKKKGGDE